MSNLHAHHLYPGIDRYLRNNQWRYIASRPKRPLTSIVLDPGVKDVILDDARDFMLSKSWYTTRGIPFRRGYLLVRSRTLGVTKFVLTPSSLVWRAGIWKDFHDP